MMQLVATALLDGEQGTLEPDPPASRVAAFEARRAADARDSVAARTLLAGPPVAWCRECLTTYSQRLSFHSARSAFLRPKAPNDHRFSDRRVEGFSRLGPTVNIHGTNEYHIMN
jgi:hypothetical protein